MRLRALSLYTTVTIRMPWRTHVSRSANTIENPPSPTVQSTGRSGRSSFAAIAAGRLYPIAESPFDSRNVRGRLVRHACETISLIDPTSVVTIVSGGKRSRRHRVTSNGDSPFVGRAAGRSVRSSSVRNAAHSSPDHLYGPNSISDSVVNDRTTSPVSSTRGRYSRDAIDSGPIDTSFIV